MEDLIRYLTNWLLDHGFECGVQVGESFEFDNRNDEIIIPLGENCPRSTEQFIKFCYAHGLEYEFSNSFIPSFFHELGHFETLHIFEDEEFEDYQGMLACLNERITDLPADEDYLAYFSHPIELEATLWGIDYINNRVDEITKMCEELSRIFSVLPS